MSDELMNFDLPVNQSSIIKVFGIGGGGSNAVNHMWHQGIKGVDFVVCNTDAQALNSSPVPVEIQIGESLTEGRGAGNKPQIGRQAALENIKEINEVLSVNTRMVFLTAGMGGGTGTGAAPVIAKSAQELGILTVAIVTIPFRFEGQQRINQAIEGINEIKEYVDSLLVINNEKLREIYGDLKLSEAFAKADNVLTMAAKGIAEIITVHGYINVDFADVETVMRESGVAILGSGMASGEGRALKAIQEALASPLLNNNDITGADNILLNITSGEEEISMDEVGEITDFVNAAASKNALIIWGTGTDENLKDRINVTIIATGFKTNSIPELYIRKKNPDRVQLMDGENSDKSGLQGNGRGDNLTLDMNNVREEIKDKTNVQRTIEFDLTGQQPKPIHLTPEDEEEVEKNEDVDKKLAERVKKLRETHEKYREHDDQLEDEEKKTSIDDLENEPAYVRKKIRLDNTTHSKESNVSKYSLSEDEEKNTRLRDDNAYLHDNVD
jgi:cell division protein FtsZ